MSRPRSSCASGSENFKCCWPARTSRRALCVGPPNHIQLHAAHAALSERQSIMALTRTVRPTPRKVASNNKATGPITLKHLAARLAADHELSKRQGAALLGGLVALITKHLKKGERIRIAGLGILQVRKRAA